MGFIHLKVQNAFLHSIHDLLQFCCIIHPIRTCDVQRDVAVFFFFTTKGACHPAEQNGQVESHLNYPHFWSVVCKTFRDGGWSPQCWRWNTLVGPPNALGLICSVIFFFLILCYKTNFAGIPLFSEQQKRSS